MDLVVPDLLSTPSPEVEVRRDKSGWCFSTEFHLQPADMRGMEDRTAWRGWQWPAKIHSPRRMAHP
jgi:hypothetical protein